MYVLRLRLTRDGAFSSIRVSWLMPALIAFLLLTPSAVSATEGGHSIDASLESSTTFAHEAVSAVLSDTLGGEFDSVPPSDGQLAIPDEIVPGSRADQIIERFRLRHTYGGIQTERRTLLQRFLDWLSRFRIRIPEGGGLEFLMYVIVISLVSGLLFYGIYRAGFRTWFRQNSVSAGYRDARTHASATSAHPDEWLSRGDYRMAVRIMLISALQQLSARGLISLHKNKTNRDYLIELSDTPEREAFAQLSKVYAWVWYGGFEPDQVQIKLARASWEALIAAGATKNADTGEAA